MLLGVMLPNERERLQIAGFQKRIDALSPEQTEYLQHLLYSWRVFDRGGLRLGCLQLVGKALRRTLNDRP